jgi:hypothetical protein
MKPDLGQDIDVHAAEEQAADRGQQAHGHDEDHRERQRPALILRRQHEEDEDHRGGEDEKPGIARQLLLIGELGPFEAESVGQGPAASFSMAASASPVEWPGAGEPWTSPAV